MSDRRPGAVIGAEEGTAASEIGRWAWLAAAVGVLIYVPSLWNGFTYDDVYIVADNEMLRSLRTLGSLLTQPYWPGEGGPELGLWRPTTSVTLALIWQASGGAAFAFHLVNVLLHGTATYLVGRVAALMMSVPAACLAALVFALHPVHVEAVANMVGMAELIAAVCVMGALLIAARTRKLGVGALSAVWLLFLLGFGAKESAVVLPGLIFVVDAVRGRLWLRDLTGWLRDRAVLLAGLGLITAAMLVARSIILDGIASTMTPLGANLLTEVPRIWTLGEIWYQTLRVVLVPTWLSPDYSPNLIQVSVFWTPRGIAGAIGVLGTLAAGLLAAHRIRRPTAADGDGPEWAAGLAAGVAWFVVAISPVSNVLFLTGVLLAERTLYLPSVGVAIAIGGILATLVLRTDTLRILRLAGTVLAAFLVLAWGTRTVTYTTKWKSNQELFTYMMQAVPESLRAQFEIGDYFLEVGDPDLAARYYRSALGKAGWDHDTLIGKAAELMSLGHPDPARLFLISAVPLRGERTTVFQLLSEASRRIDDRRGAERWARAAADARPDDPTAWFLLATLYAEREAWADAARVQERVLRLDTVNAWQPWFALAEFRARAGDLDGAVAASDSARGRAGEPAVRARLDSLLNELGVDRGR
jgi:hypothetical protein